MLVDAMAARMIQAPRSLDVLLASNLFGDILSDLAAVLAGGMGMAPSANVRARRATCPGIYEPVHGSAPDIAGQGRGQPGGLPALRRDAAGGPRTRRRGRPASATRWRPPCETPDHHTADLGGSATTAEVGAAVLQTMEKPVVEQ